MTSSLVLSQKAHGERERGVALVFASALIWSFGGAIARFIATPDSWTVVLWRSVWAALFLVAFMLVRNGPRGTVALFWNMGLPGVAVAVFLATASTSFIMALSYTTVANILLMQAGVPLIAALLAWTLFREKVPPATWAAIAAVIIGVAVMVSDSVGGTVSWIGNGLALLISVSFALATVLTRRYARVRMTPASCLATLIAAGMSCLLAGGYGVSALDMGLLFAFGALNLGLGLAFFVTGVRLVPSAVAALVGTLETVLGPVWVWLVHGETPSQRTLLGGAIVLAALIAHVGWQLHTQRRVMNAALPN
jgi:drug/metabolite transporter (DMT)-like permease